MLKAIIVASKAKGNRNLMKDSRSFRFKHICLLSYSAMIEILKQVVFSM